MSLAFRRRSWGHTEVVGVADTLGFLLGSWTLERHLVDGSGVEAAFTGTATVRLLESGSSAVRAEYSETGRLRLPASSYDGAAGRRLVFVEDCGAVRVEFCDGRPFVSLDLRGGSWRAEHLCGDDTYELGYAILADDLLEETWRATGPEASFRARTLLRRS
jgi:hypothetical protein